MLRVRPFSSRSAMYFSCSARGSAASSAREDAPACSGYSRPTWMTILMSRSGVTWSTYTRCQPARTENVTVSLTCALSLAISSRMMPCASTRFRKIRPSARICGPGMYRCVTRSSSRNPLTRNAVRMRCTTALDRPRLLEISVTPSVRDSVEANRVSTASARSTPWMPENPPVSSADRRRSRTGSPGREIRRGNSGFRHRSCPPPRSMAPRMDTPSLLSSIASLFRRAAGLSPPGSSHGPYPGRNLSHCSPLSGMPSQLIVSAYLTCG